MSRCALVRCTNCQHTTCPNHPVPQLLYFCEACDCGIYDDQEHYNIDGVPVHYDCLHKYHKDDLVR